MRSAFLEASDTTLQRLQGLTKTPLDKLKIAYFSVVRPRRD